MNIALEKAQEFADDDKPRRSYGDTFVRGNNGIIDYARAHIFAFGFLLELSR